MLKKLSVSGFKSLNDFSLTPTTNLISIAGENGVGKSNICDALLFLKSIFTNGFSKSLREFGGTDYIYRGDVDSNGYNRISYKLCLTQDLSRYEQAIPQEFEYGIYPIYELDIFWKENEVRMDERLYIGQQLILDRQNNEISLRLENKLEKVSALKNYNPDISSLNIVDNNPISEFIENIKVYRFNPISAKSRISLVENSEYLDSDGKNLALILSKIEQDNNLRETILDWLNLIVPSLSDIKIDKNDKDCSINFYEKYDGNRYPSQLVSDGTMYVLCILTAILSNRDKSNSLILIEEPERGIHPKAISELINFMRDQVSEFYNIIITTHSESVVRSINIDEFWIAVRNDGKTIVKHASEVSKEAKNMNLDKAWLMNVFDGGIPW